MGVETVFKMSYSSGSANVDNIQAHLNWKLKIEDLKNSKSGKHFKSKMLKIFVYEDEINWQLWVNFCEERDEKRIFVVPLSHTFKENTDREIKCSVFFRTKYSEVFMKSFKKGLSQWKGIGEGFSFSSNTLLEMTNSGCLDIIVDLSVPVSIKETKCESQKRFNTDIYAISKMDQFSDVTIICKDNKFACHKIILAARSTVFQTMLEKDMLEKNNNIVQIEDSTPETVKAMLDHIYTGCLPAKDLTDLDNLLYLSVKYNLMGLMNSFETNMRNSKSPKTVLKNLVLCFLYFSESETFSELIKLAKEIKTEMTLEDSWGELVEFYPALSNMILT